MSDASELGALLAVVVLAFTGSVASSVRGEFRATNDVDIVATLEARHLERLMADLWGFSSRRESGEAGTWGLRHERRGEWSVTPHASGY